MKPIICAKGWARIDMDTSKRGKSLLNAHAERWLWPFCRAGRTGRAACMDELKVNMIETILLRQVQHTRQCSHCHQSPLAIFVGVPSTLFHQRWFYQTLAFRTPSSLQQSGSLHCQGLYPLCANNASSYIGIVGLCRCYWKFSSEAAERVAQHPYSMAS